MNNVYIYDGKFVSLINLIEFLLKNKIVVANIKNTEYTGNLFENLINIKIENKPMSYFINKYHDNLKRAYYVYLSNNENKEIIIYYYLLNYHKYKDNLDKMRNLKCVREVLKISNHVANEAHRFKGFTRFQELKNNILYATIAPDNNILEILSNHFQKRLKNEYWIIKDTKREIISIYNKKRIMIFKTNQIDIKEIAMSDKELVMEKLWQTFYNTIGIKERKNDRCRMNFMPKKYWQNILEVRDEL